MQVIISLASDKSVEKELTPQAKEAEVLAEQRRLDNEYATENLTPEEIKQREQAKQEQAEARKKDDPNRLPDEVPADLGKSKIDEESSATQITNRHDNLPDAQI